MHPKVLEDEDFTYYDSIKDNIVDELYLSFSTTRLNPWTHKPEEIFLSTNRELEITELNKVSVILFWEKMGSVCVHPLYS